VKRQDNEKTSADLARAYRILESLTGLGNISRDAADAMGWIADAQEIVRRDAVDEATIRADERAKVDAEIVAWLRSHLVSMGGGPSTFYADRIECGEHRR